MNDLPSVIGNCATRRVAARRNAVVRFLTAGAWLGSLFGAACSEPSERFEQLYQPVLDGQASGRENVVLIDAQGPDIGGNCTATVVAPNLLLTARHCISSFVGGDYACTVDGNLDLTVSRSPANAGEMGAVFDDTAIQVFLGQDPDLAQPAATSTDILAPDTSTICRNDIAFVVLDRDLDVEPAKLRLSTGVAMNEMVTVVGYGINDAKTTARFERSGIPIQAVGPSEFHPIEGFAPPRTFIIGRSVCPGDSGGPSISDETGAVLGVFSLTRGDCVDSEARVISTQLAPYRELTQRAFERAGYEPITDTPAATPGSPRGGAGGEPSAEAPEPPVQEGGCSFAPAGGKPFQAGLGLLLASLWAARIARQSKNSKTVGGVR